ncbi:MAG TPA: formyltransferase family protein [Patescibacteria group bacterium]|nr:formyltransferase family protein [Patescibacteria group bacterium]
MVEKPRVLVFASGSKDGGGSGLLHLVLNAQTGVLGANIVGVVSNYKAGGVRKIAAKYEVPFYHFIGPFTAEMYQSLAQASRANWFLLSGWLKFVRGLPADKTINIHPGDTEKFGGPGLYGHHVHEAVIKAFQAGEVTCSCVTMHFVTDGATKAEYDRGPVFFKYPVGIEPDDTAETLAARVNRYEHGWQSYMTNLVVRGDIWLTGMNQVMVPAWYRSHPGCPKEVI